MLVCRSAASVRSKLGYISLCVQGYDKGSLAGVGCQRLSGLANLFFLSFSFFFNECFSLLLNDLNFSFLFTESIVLLWHSLGLRYNWFVPVLE